MLLKRPPFSSSSLTKVLLPKPPQLLGEVSLARQLQVIIHGRLCCPVARFLLRFLNPSCSRCRGRAIRLDNSRYASMRSCFPVARYFLNVIAIPSRPCCWGRTIRFDDSWYVRRAQYCARSSSDKVFFSRTRCRFWG